MLIIHAIMFYCLLMTNLHMDSRLCTQPTTTTTTTTTEAARPSGPTPPIISSPPTQAQEVLKEIIISPPPTTHAPEVPEKTTISSARTEVSDTRTVENFDDIIFKFQTTLIQETPLSKNFSFSPHSAVLTRLILDLSAGRRSKNEASITLPLDMNSPRALGIKSLIESLSDENSCTKTTYRIAVHPKLCTIDEELNKTMRALGMPIHENDAMRLPLRVSIVFNPKLTCADFPDNIFGNLQRKLNRNARYGHLPSLNEAEFIEFQYTGLNNSLYERLIFIRPVLKGNYDIQSIKQNFSKLNFNDFSKYTTKEVGVVLFPFSTKTLTLHDIFPNYARENSITDSSHFCSNKGDMQTNHIALWQIRQSSPARSHHKNDPTEEDTDVNGDDLWKSYIMMLVSNKSILFFRMHSSPASTRAPEVPEKTTISSARTEVSDTRTFENFDDAIFKFQTMLIQETPLSKNFTFSPHSVTITLLIMALRNSTKSRNELSAVLNLRASDLSLPLDLESSTALGIKSLIKSLSDQNSCTLTKFEILAYIDYCMIDMRIKNMMRDLGVRMSLIKNGDGYSAMEFYFNSITKVQCQGFPDDIFGETQRKLKRNARYGNLPSLNGSEFIQFPYTGLKNNSYESLIFIRPALRRNNDIESIKKEFSKLNYDEFSNYKTKEVGVVLYPYKKKRQPLSRVFPSHIVTNLKDDFSDFCTKNQETGEYPVIYMHDHYRSNISNYHKEVPTEEDTNVNGDDLWRSYIMMLVSNKSIHFFRMHSDIHG